MAAKLTYFPFSGLGEPVRLTLASANIPFEDERVNKEEFAKLKASLPWGQLPRLEIDGKVLYQSRAICRYIARKSGLAGSDDFEAALIDMTVDVLDDFRAKVVREYYTPDSPDRDAALANCRQTVAPFYLSRLEKQVDENNGYLVAGKVGVIMQNEHTRQKMRAHTLRVRRRLDQTFRYIVHMPKHTHLSWADTLLVAYSDYLGHILSVNLIDDYPQLKEVVAKVSQLEGVKRYLASRPQLPTNDFRTFFC